MNRRFPLATVLRVRRIEEDLARGSVAQTRAAAARADALVASRAEVLVSSSLPAGTDALHYVAALEGLARRARDVTNAENVRVTSYDAVEGALAAWGRARTRTRGLERLEERHGDAVRAADEHAEARERDDRTGAAHHRRATTAQPTAQPTAQRGGIT